YLDALIGVDHELHDAAKVYGASIMKIILHINVSSIKLTIVILYILHMGQIMQIGFEKVLLMTNQFKSETTGIILTVVYITGILEGRYSYAAAIGLFESIVNIVLLIAVNQNARKARENSLW